MGIFSFISKLFRTKSNVRSDTCTRYPNCIGCPDCVRVLKSNFVNGHYKMHSGIKVWRGQRINVYKCRKYDIEFEM